MARSKKVIITTNKEIYNKLNDLFLTSQVVLEKVKFSHIKRIVNSINKSDKFIEMEQIGNYVLLKRKKPLDRNFSLYFK